MKKIFLLLVVSLMLVGVVSATDISTCEELQDMKYNLTADYYLTSDIDCSDTVNWDSGAGFAPIGTFTGTFDGNGHKITGLYINHISSHRVGLFGETGSGAVIKNVGLVDVNVIANRYLGGLVGFNDGTIFNSYTTGSVVGNYQSVGGLVGEGGSNAKITNSYSTADISGYRYIGGLVGFNDGTITNSYATGSVTGSSYSYDAGGLVGENRGTIINSNTTGTVTGYRNIGGLVGRNDYNAFIINSYATGSVTGSYGVGGLVGENDNQAVITDAYATGNVTGNYYVGGLVGENIGGGVITNSYSIGNVTGSYYVGGLVGGNSGSIINSYWDIETSGQSTSAGGTGKTTAEMMQQSTYAISWDFDYIWAIDEGVGYPYLVGRSTGKGIGTEADPYQITDCEELQEMKFRLGSHFILTDDIDCYDATHSGGSLWNDGKGFEPVGMFPNYFKGTFDGQNHTITGLYIKGGGYVGLFGGVSFSSTIKNVGLVNVNITGSGYPGRVGGLVGLNYGTIFNSYTTGSVVSNYQSVGGLVGEVGEGSNAKITNSYSTADISGYRYIGGLVGRNHRGTVINSYATGSVSGGDYTGGLVGLNYYGNVTNSYYDTDTSGQSDTGKGEPKTTAEMMTQSTFVDWNFVDIWGIYEGVSYPYLQWQIWQIIDSDGDGIPDDEDNCPGTVADVPNKSLGTNRWIWNGSSAWETKLPEGGGPDKVFTMEDTHGCSCFQILDSMGGKMTGHWKFGCSISVMEDFIMSLSPLLVDTVYVDSANMDGADSEIVLESGTNYRFEAMGTWKDNSQPDHYIDAEYTTFDNWTTYLDGTPSLGPNQKDLQVDGAFVDWGSYSDVNTYYLDYAGTGSTVNFRVFDAGWYPDNVGSLTVNIYELP